MLLSFVSEVFAIAIVKLMSGLNATGIHEGEGDVDSGGVACRLDFANASGDGSNGAIGGEGDGVEGSARATVLLV